MTKNEVIKVAIEGLLESRRELAQEIAIINRNETNYDLKRMDIEQQISTVDDKINFMIGQLEYGQS